MPNAKRTRPAAPRKRPKQERSAATVEAILEAAGREMAAAGYEAATTKRIAELAGISVGSLYQYFPSKVAIAVELARRHRAGRVAFVAESLRKVGGDGGEPTERVIRGLFESFLLAEGIRPELYRVLIEQVVRTSARHELRGYEERLEAIVVETLCRLRPSPKVEDYELTAFILVRLVLALVHAAAADTPRYNTPALANELTKLVVAYLGLK